MYEEDRDRSRVKEWKSLRDKEVERKEEREREKSSKMLEAKSERSERCEEIKN